MTTITHQDDARNLTLEAVGPIQVLFVESSTVCPDHDGAVDADVVLCGTGETYGVTLLPRQSDGVLDSWGDLDCWLAGPSTGELPREVLGEIVAEVRSAAELEDFDDEADEADDEDEPGDDSPLGADRGVPWA